MRPPDRQRLSPLFGEHRFDRVRPDSHNDERAASLTSIATVPRLQGANCRLDDLTPPRDRRISTKVLGVDHASTKNIEEKYLRTWAATLPVNQLPIVHFEGSRAFVCLHDPRPGSPGFSLVPT